MSLCKGIVAKVFIQESDTKMAGNKMEMSSAQEFCGLVALN